MSDVFEYDIYTNGWLINKLVVLLSIIIMAVIGVICDFIVDLKLAMLVIEISDISVLFDVRLASELVCSTKAGSIHGIRGHRNGFNVVCRRNFRKFEGVLRADFV